MENGAENMHIDIACARLSVSGDERKSGRAAKSRRAKNVGKNGLVSPQPPRIFRATLFSRSVFPTILEPGTG